MSLVRPFFAAALLTIASVAHAAGVEVEMRNAEGQEVLNKILDDTGFWADADISNYNNKLYDEIRLKKLDSGYVPLITGEGDEDFPHDVVADIVFEKNTLLPKYMDGAKSVVLMGKGYDDTVGAEYRDCFYILDLTLFYGVFPQRMYRRHDEATNQTVLWFEKIKPEWVDAATWSKYEARMTKEVEEMDKRWAFNSVVPVGDVYGMFVVEPGENRESRVTFVSKLTFDEQAGWMAKMGSQMPPVLKSGLKSGFGASVNIARHEKQRREQG